MSGVVTLGAGKSATSHSLQAAAQTYAKLGFRSVILLVDRCFFCEWKYCFSLLNSFYHADERFVDGTPVSGAIDGEAHAEFCHELAKINVQGPWLATFAKGVGYVDFTSKGM